MPQIVVTLAREEHDALVALAARELRRPQEQARLLIRRELELSGRLERARSLPTDQVAAGISGDEAEHDRVPAQL